MTHPRGALAPGSSTPEHGVPQAQADATEPDDAPHVDPLLGSLLGGRYRIEAALGHGGMADVYRALDEKLRRHVAIKLFRPGSDASADRARFRSEVHTLAGLSHPSLVALFDSGQDVQRPWCVMQYVDGGTLADAGLLAPDRVARIGAEICEALDYIHGLGIVHRDVKPSNVLLDSDGSAYLSDFGVAQIVDATRMTASGALLGTAAYLSPEQVLGKPASEAVDVYALALVMLETITGTREYPGTPIESAVARLSRPPQVPGWLGPEWTALLHAMTEVEPTSRPPAREVATRLRALARQVTPPQPIMVGRPSPLPAAAEPARPMVRSIALGRIAGRPLEELSDGTSVVRPIDRFTRQSRLAMALEGGVLVAAAVLGIGVLVPLIGAHEGTSQLGGSSSSAASAAAVAAASAIANGADPQPAVANTAPDPQTVVTAGPHRGTSGALGGQPAKAGVTVTVTLSGGRSTVSVSPSPTAAPTSASPTPSTKPSPSGSPSSSPKSSPSTSPKSSPSASTKPTASASAEPSLGTGGGGQGGAQGGGPGPVAGGPNASTVPSPSGA